MSSSTTDRVLGVLALFLDNKTEWSVEEAAKALELPVSTVYRYFKSLAKSGFIYSYVTGHYVLGPAIVQFDRQIRLSDPLLLAAIPQMTELAEEVNTHAVLMLARHYDNQAMCVYQRLVGEPGFAVSYERGRLMPLNRGAASKVILATLGSKALHKLNLDEDGRSELRSALRKIRKQGFAMTQGELDKGVRGLSVPIMQADNAVIGSLSIILADHYAEYPQLIAPLLSCQKKIEKRLNRQTAKAITE